MRKRAAAVLPVSLFLMAGICALPIARDARPYIEGRLEAKRLADRAAVHPASKEADPDNTFLGIQIDFDYLKKQNEDIIGWIYIPGTQVNYAVMQHKQDNQYYLHHTPEKEENILGSVYMYKESSSDFTDQSTILFGHNMRSGQMFGELSNYEEEDFYWRYPYVYIFTPEKSMRYSVCSAYACAASDETFTTGYQAETDAYENYLSHIKENSVIKAGQMPDWTDKIITLSTCTDGGPASWRFVVHCVLDKEKEEML